MPPTKLRRKWSNTTLSSSATSISVFFPCFNDAKSIGILVKDAFAILPSVSHDYEVIVVDDGSTDNSRQILQKLANRYSNLRVIYHPRNFGYGGALQTGFAAATKKLVFYTDGDGQYDVKELVLLLKLMTKDVNFVNGFKMSRQDPTYRIFLGNLYSFIVRWMFWCPIYDVDCDFRLVRRSLLKGIHLQCTSGAICLELIKQAQAVGAKFRQVSVHHYERRFGQSQFFRPWRLLHTLGELIWLWTKQWYNQ